MSWYNGKRYQQRSSKLRAQNLHERNVKSAQENTLKREAASGEAYAKKAQADYERGKNTSKKSNSESQRSTKNFEGKLLGEKRVKEAVPRNETKRQIMQAFRQYEIAKGSTTGSAYGDKMRENYEREYNKAQKRKAR